MVGHKKVVLTLLLVTLLGAFFIPLQPVAVIANNKQQNYRGTLTISAQTFDFLLGFPKGHIRFAIWDGKSWIELPFWIVHRPEYQTHIDIDMNNTGTGITGHVIHSEQLSASDYFVLVIPNKKGHKVDINNWWPLARKSGFDRRAQLLIGEDPSTVNISSGNSDSQGLLNSILFGDNTNNEVPSVIYIYFGRRVTLPPPKYTLRDVYYSFDKVYDPTMNNTSIKTHSPIAKTFADLKERFPINYKLISVSNVEKENISTFKTRLLLDVMVMQRQFSFKFYRFKDTGYKFLDGESFYLPPIQYIDECQVRLEIKGLAPVGSYQRYLTILLENPEGSYYLKQNEKVQNSFSFDFDISDKVVYSESTYYNELSIKLPTWSDGSAHPGEYWIVNATVYYFYYATRDKLGTYTLDIAKPRYDFKQTGWNMIKFPFPLPSNKIYDTESHTVTFDLNFTSVSDPWTRILKVYLITDYETSLIYSGTITPGTRHVQFYLSADQVQDYLSSVTEAEVGIVLTTYVGYWKLTGQVRVTYRPAVFSDESTLWSNLYIPYLIRAGNIFARLTSTQTYLNELHGIYVYSVFYYKKQCRFKSELSTFLLTNIPTKVSTATIQVTVEDNNHQIHTDETFDDILKKQYNPGISDIEDHKNLIKGAAIFLKGASKVVKDPTVKTILDLGSMGLNMLAGTTTTESLGSRTDNPLTLTFNGVNLPQYDSSCNKYYSRENFYVYFEDAHTSGGIFYYLSHVTINVNGYTDVISLDDTFTFTK